MASSGNFVNDVIERHLLPGTTKSIKLSMWATFVIGSSAVLIAAQFSMVLDVILYAYAFMVSGLFIPTLGAFFWKRGSANGALISMMGGGFLTLLLQTGIIHLPDKMMAFGLDFGFYGIVFSALLYTSGSLLWPDAQNNKQ